MACPSDAEFTDDDRHSEDCKEDQIHQNERSAAVHARHVGEFPYITRPIAQPADTKIKPRRLPNFSLS